jgi:hypothetical protein
MPSHLLQQIAHSMTLFRLKMTMWVYWNFYIDSSISYLLRSERTTALAHSQTQQPLLEVIHSISHRAFQRTYKKYHSIHLATSVISKTQATVRLPLLREAGRSPVGPVIARQVIRAMALVMKRILTPYQLKSVGEICDLYIIVWTPLHECFSSDIVCS